MSRFLLDTNILSEPLKLRPNQGVMEKLQRHELEVAIASVTWHEILFGCYRLPASRKRENRTYAQTLHIVGANGHSPLPVAVQPEFCVSPKKKERKVNNPRFIPSGIEAGHVTK